MVRQTGPVKSICDIRGGAGDAIDVQVTDFTVPPRCLAPPEPFVRFQWRTYGWDGAKFAQTGGPGNFPVNAKVTDLSLSTTGLVFGAPTNGVYHGSMTVTISNQGASKMAYTLNVLVPSYLTPVPQNGCTVDAANQRLTCQPGTLAAGAKKVMTLQFTSTGAGSTSVSTYVSVSVPEGYGDSDRSNDSAEYTVKF